MWDRPGPGVAAVALLAATSWTTCFYDWEPPPETGGGGTTASGGTTTSGGSGGLGAGGTDVGTSSTDSPICISCVDWVDSCHTGECAWVEEVCPGEQLRAAAVGQCVCQEIRNDSAYTCPSCDYECWDFEFGCFAAACIDDCGWTTILEVMDGPASCINHC